LDGQSEQRSDVIDYADTLTQSGKFGDVRIALIEQVPDAVAAGTGSGFIFRIIIRR
jgi:hypothetical protein